MRHSLWVLYERKGTPPISKRQFAFRMVQHAGVVAGALLAVLGLGVMGYHFFGGLPWIDALLNASMILGGMGPVDPLPSAAAKVFASLYALFSGLVFIAATGFFVAPIMHRVMHWLHWESQD